MQKLALMMAVMILGMSPAHGCSIGANPRSQGVGGQTEMMPLLPTWSGGDEKNLMAKDTVSSSAAEGNQPVEPGGHSIGRILQQILLGVEGLERMRSEIMRIGQDEAKEAPGKGRTDPTRGRRIKTTDPRVKRRQRRQKL
jgi:hypothetical protein